MSMAFSPEGDRLAIGDRDGSVQIVAVPSGRQLALQQHAHKGSIWALGFSPDGHSILTWGLGKEVQVWDTERGELRYPPVLHRDKCHDVQLSPDGRLMAGGGSKRDMLSKSVIFDYI